MPHHRPHHRRPALTRRHVLALGAVTAASATAYALAPGFAPAGQAAPKAPSAPPKGVHPRVLVARKHLDAIRAKLKDPVVAPRYETLEKAAALDTDGKLPDGLYSLPVKSAIEANAFLHLLHGDKDTGRRAVSQLRNFLATFKPLDPHEAPVTDIRRTGTTLYTAALVYDWCHGLLTEDDQKALIAGMKNLAGHQEVGYPPTELGALTTHAGEYELMRDQLAAGIAVYDEDPEMFDLASTRISKEFVPARNFFYRAGRHHQGDSYQGTRFAPEIFATVLYSRMGSDSGFDSAQQEVLTDWIYQRRPDGQLMRSGDTFHSSYIPPGRYWADAQTTAALLLSTAHYKNQWHQGDLLSQLEHGYKGGAEEALTFCLFYHPDLPGRAASTLPLTRFNSRPLAGMTARTGWDDGPEANAVIAHVNIGGHQFNNHSHLDAGAFQLYYRGALALDSGVYEGKNGGWASDHDINYHKRTVAHNALLIVDPAETFAWQDKKIANDGGQRFPLDGHEAETLDVLLDPENHYTNASSATGWAGPDRDRPVFSHVKGDITPAYGSKARSCVRSFVFVNLGGEGRPAALLVRDSLTTTDPSFRTAFLLHSAEKPQVDGAQVDIARTDEGYSGKLRMTTLWPADPRLTTIGGPGHEYEVDGTNYPNPVLDDSSADPGAWRVEVSPPEQGEQTELLHVLQPHAADTDPFTVDTTHTDGAFLVRLHDTLTLFSDQGHLLRGPVDFDVSEEAERVRFLATDLGRTDWKLAPRGDSGGTVGGQVRSGSILYAELTPGAYRLSE